MKHLIFIAVLMVLVTAGCKRCFECTQEVVIDYPDFPGFPADTVMYVTTEQCYNHFKSVALQKEIEAEPGFTCQKVD